MFDQTFSPENLQIISDIEGRRGSSLNLTFFPEVKLKTDTLKERIDETKEFRKTHKAPYNEADQILFNGLRENRETARKDRDDTLQKCLLTVSKKISKKNYVVEIEQASGPKGKPVYIAPKFPEPYFAIKHVNGGAILGHSSGGKMRSRAA